MKTYTEKEVLEMIERAFWDGVHAGSTAYAGEAFDPKEYLPKEELKPL